MLKNGRNNVDLVNTGLEIMIIGLLTILLASNIADFLSLPGRTFAVQDKVSMISDTVSPVGIQVLGALVVIIGTAIFLRNLMNMLIDSLILRFDGQADNQVDNVILPAADIR